MKEILEQVEESCQDKKWNRSLNKIYHLYKKGVVFGGGTFDSHCLKEKLCLVCNQKSHRIDFDEELAKKYSWYTYHGDSAWELSNP